MEEFGGPRSDGERLREEHRVLSDVGQHPTRRRILACIGSLEPKSEGEISASLGLSSWEVRYHLAQLRLAELVEGRDGRYRLLPLGVGLLREVGREGGQDVGRDCGRDGGEYRGAQ